MYFINILFTLTSAAPSCLTALMQEASLLLPCTELADIEPQGCMKTDLKTLKQLQLLNFEGQHTIDLQCLESASTTLSTHSAKMLSNKQI